MLSSELDCRYDPFTREQACELLWIYWPWHTRACLFRIHVMIDQWMVFHSMYSTVTFAFCACIAHELPAASVLQHLLFGSVFIVWLGCIHVCVCNFILSGRLPDCMPVFHIMRWTNRASLLHQWVCCCLS